MSQALHTSTLATRTRYVPVNLLIAATLVLAGLVGVWFTSHAATARAVADAGPELTRLLRAMALLKLVIAAAGTAFVTWRLRFPANRALTAAYLASLAAMAAGPGLIWAMAHVVPGAVLLHAGLAALIILFWRDPGSPAMLPRRRVANRA